MKILVVRLLFLEVLSNVLLSHGYHQYMYCKIHA